MSNRINPLTGRRFDWEAQQREAKGDDVREAHKHIALLERQQMALKAREDFMTFVKFTSPDPEDPNDIHRSKYKNARHHDATAKVIEQVIAGEIPFLIITLPPRHGKSQLVSRHLPAWFMGKFPEQHGVVATYSDDFAAEFGKEVRTLLHTPQYKQVFPETRLMRGGAASDKLQTTKGGQWSFVGRGGGLTGRGAHCFPAGTMVTTDIGDVKIEQLCSAVGQRMVLSFNKKDSTLEFKRLAAFARRPKARLYRVTTAAGRVVEATGDHPFWTGSGYTEVRLLTPGDRLVRLVRNGDNEEGRKISRNRAAWDQTALLRPELLLETPELRVGANQDGKEDRVSQEASAVSDLQYDVHGEMARSEVRTPDVLCEGVRGSRALEKDVVCREPPVEGQRQSKKVAASRQESVSGTSTSRASTGSVQVRGLRETPPGEAGSTPHRQRPFELGLEQSSDALLKMSSSGACVSGWQTEEDAVALVERLCVDADVYDIEVEDNHNFFANDVCVSNCLICDDLIKDDKEAQSQAIRDQAWNWFTKVAMSRRMGKKLVILTFTRWHNDDPIGRLTDPENPHYNRTLAERIKIINLPAIAEDDDPLGRKPGEPLWPDGPDKFDLPFLEEQRSLDPLGFAALYQQRPSLLDGDLFKRPDIRFYKSHELPADLRIYGASDHAVATGQRNDFTVLLKIGVDPQNNIYLIDCFWQKAKSDIVVEAMLNMARGDKRPLLWWAERGHISKSIGPFLMKRMAETSNFMAVREVTPVGDKAQRAQSIAGRVAMGKLFFPSDAHWTERAINEMMAFPNGTHDDFVDTLSLIGLGMQSQFAASPISVKKDVQPAFGTLSWVKLADKWAAEKSARARFGGF